MKTDTLKSEIHSGLSTAEFLENSYWSEVITILIAVLKGAKDADKERVAKLTLELPLKLLLPSLSKASVRKGEMLGSGHQIWALG